MTVYLLLACIPLIATGYYQQKKTPYENKKRGIIIWCSVALLLLLSLRSMMVGSKDSFNYTNSWIRFSKMSFPAFLKYAAISRTENGFELWQWCCSHLFPAPQFQFFLSGLILVLCLAHFMYRYCEDVLLGYTMFICLGLLGFMMQGMRQAIAMSICLLSIDFIKDRKPIKFVITVAFACMFHQSAIVFLMLYFLYGRTVNVKTLLMSVAFVFAFFVFNSRIIGFANDFFNRTYENNVDSGGFIAVAVYVLILLLGLLTKPNIKNDVDFSFAFFLTALGCAIYVVRYFGVQAAERISFYFMFGQIILLPKALGCFNTVSRRLVYFVVWTLCLLLFAYRLRTSVLTPYLFFWQA